MLDMVRRRSALDEIYQTGDFGELDVDGPGVTLCERQSLNIIQVSAWYDHADEVVSVIEQASGVKPSRMACSAVLLGNTAAVWVGPERWLIVEKESRDLYKTIAHEVSADMAAITDQSHSRCILRLSGTKARTVLRKGTTLDMDTAYFKTGEAKTTSLFHMNALIHCLSDEVFDIYVARSFGYSFFEVISHAAMEYGYRVTDPV